MRLVAMTLHRLRLPLVSPFTTSFGSQTEREALLVELAADAGGERVVGWGECVALPDPVYSSEYLDGCAEVIERFLGPALAAHDVTAETVAHHLGPIKGHRMAKAAVEMAVLDAQLRRDGRSFASYAGAVVDRVPSGVSVGIHDTVGELLDAVAAYLGAGYVRIKLKIKPGWDVEPVRAVRDQVGDDVPLQVDANAAYTLADAAHLCRLDEFGLLLIEQPLGEEDLRQHAALARQMHTPVCLDESIVSAGAAADAIALGAAAVINIKPGRVGGYLEAIRIHDLARANGVAVWCGGMLETGLGRAANAALAALPGFTLPGDISASDRFYREDITAPFVLDAGHIRVPDGPGFGVDVIPARLEAVRVAQRTIDITRV
jgi:O-succinylbenzoate synthase